MVLLSLTRCGSKKLLTCLSTCCNSENFLYYFINWEMLNQVIYIYISWRMQMLKYLLRQFALTTTYGINSFICCIFFFLSKYR
jgi:hypothetical protein